MKIILTVADNVLFPAEANAYMKFDVEGMGGLVFTSFFSCLILILQIKYNFFGGGWLEQYLGDLHGNSHIDQVKMCSS